MKNIWKIMIALALVLCMMTALVSCNLFGNDDDAGTDDGGTNDGGTEQNPPAEDPGNDTTGEDGNLENKGPNTDPDYDFAG